MTEVATYAGMAAGELTGCEVKTFDGILGKVPNAIFFLSDELEPQDSPENASKVVIAFTDNTFILFEHHQDCCENVEVESAVGDLADIIGSPLLLAEEVTSESLSNDDYESVTWTFYRFGTAKGDLSIRWVGSSSGYYSERVEYRQGNLSFNGTDPVEFLSGNKRRLVLERETFKADWSKNKESF